MISFGCTEEVCQTVKFPNRSDKYIKSRAYKISDEEGIPVTRNWLGWEFVAYRNFHVGGKEKFKTTK